jgi:hypothetical protein
MYDHAGDELHLSLHYVSTNYASRLTATVTISGHRTSWPLRTHVFKRPQSTTRAILSWGAYRAPKPTRFTNNSRVPSQSRHAQDQGSGEKHEVLL